MASRSPEIVRAFEYGRIDLPRRWDTARIRERLELASARVGVRAFETRGRHLYALGITGVVDLGQLVVEILPKVSRESTAAEGQLFLTDLLRFGGVLKQLAIIDAQIATGERTMLEVILAWAAREASRNFSEGMPKRYEAREETSTAVRGRIQLAHMARQRPGKEFELRVRYAPMTEDNALSRIIRWLVGRISEITRVTNTQVICRRLIQDFGPTSREVAVCDLERLVLQPGDLRWQPLLDLARLLISQDAPNPGRAGETQAIAVLFRLHDLFERCLRRIFTEGLPQNGVELRRLSRHLLRAVSNDSMLLQLRPDFVFQTHGEKPRTFIGDAKWKRIVAANGEISLSEADAYQIVAYLTSLNAEEGVVFCPLAATPGSGLWQVHSYGLMGTKKKIHVVGTYLPQLITPGAIGANAREMLCKCIAELFEVAQAGLAA